MTQSREPLGIMENGPNNVDFSTKGPRRYYVSKTQIFVVCVIFSMTLVATSFIVYNFAACPSTDQLANVTKYELLHCEHEHHDHSRLFVVPLTTEHTRVIPLETTMPPHLQTTENYKDTSLEPILSDIRLPTTIKPEKYYLKLIPYIVEGNFTFDGEVSIVISVRNYTQVITFHAVDLTFLRIILVKQSDGRRIVILKKIEDVFRQFHSLLLNERLEAGQKYLLNITYTGILNDNLHGFYRSSCDEKNTTR